MRFMVRGSWQKGCLAVASAVVVGGSLIQPAAAAHPPPEPPLGPYDRSVLADSPVGYWPLGGSGTAYDLTGHRHHGKYVKKPAATKLPNGQSASKFNGSTQYVNIPDAAYLSVSKTGRFTLEAWMRPDTLQFKHQEKGYVHWMGKGGKGRQEYVARMYSKSTDRPNRISGYAFNPGGGLGAGSYFQDQVKAGKWIHYVLVINTKERSKKFPTGYVRIYKNGVPRDADSLKGYNIVPKDGSAPLRIGTRDFKSFFQGAVGKVAVYGKELPTARVKAHYQAM